MACIGSRGEGGLDWIGPAVVHCHPKLTIVRNLHCSILCPVSWHGILEHGRNLRTSCIYLYLYMHGLLLNQLLHCINIDSELGFCSKIYCVSISKTANDQNIKGSIYIFLAACCRTDAQLHSNLNYCFLGGKKHILPCCQLLGRMCFFFFPKKRTALQIVWYIYAIRKK